MAGHSKWANIQHRKKAQDKKRGSAFTKLIRAITVAARLGGEDLDSNPRLRLAIDKALSANMSKDTINRAIKRGAGGLEGANVEELTFEGYGPGGVAILVFCMTDNRNRTVAEVRHAFTKFGCGLGTLGSVDYLFVQRGIIYFPPNSDENKIMEIALEAGADDIITNDDKSIEVITTTDTFSSIKQALNDAEFDITNAEITKIANTKIDIDKEKTEKLLHIVDQLENLDDVQEVYTNANVA